MTSDERHAHESSQLNCQGQQREGQSMGYGTKKSSSKGKGKKGNKVCKTDYRSSSLPHPVEIAAFKI